MDDRNRATAGKSAARSEITDKIFEVIGFYKPRIEALQYDGEYYIAIHNWLKENNGSVSFLNGKLFYGNDEIEKTDWVVRREGKFAIFTDEAFVVFFVPDDFVEDKHF